MSSTKWASEIAKREGKKSQARIGDIREILKIIIDMDSEINQGEQTIIDWLVNESDIMFDKKFEKENKKAAKK
ncbi:MAG TPA: hypothetical protein VF679_09955 [Pedobacter sp.]